MCKGREEVDMGGLRLSEYDEFRVKCFDKCVKIKRKRKTWKSLLVKNDKTSKNKMI